MSVSTVSTFRVRVGNISAAETPQQQEPEFHNHGVAIALQRQMTRPECLEYVFETGNAVISHW